MRDAINQHMRFAFKTSFFFSLILSLVFLIVGLNPVVSVACSLIVGLHIFTGIMLYQHYLGTRSANLAEYIAIGFALGSALSVFSGLLLRPILDPSLGWLIPTLVLIIFALIRPGHVSPRIVLNYRIEALDALAIFTIAFLYLAQDSHWPVLFFLCGALIYVGLSIKIHSKSSRLQFRSLTFGGAFCAAVVGIIDRSPYWDYLSDDFRVFESLSRSIWNFGPQDPYGTIGTIGAQYHISTYAYSGLLDRLSGAETFAILNRGMLVLTAVLLSTVIWAFLRRNGGRNRLVNLGLAAMFPLFFDYSFTSPSYCFGLFVFLCGMLYWTDEQTDKSVAPRLIIGVLLTYFSLSTKISNIPVILSGLGLIVLIGVFTNRSWKTSAIINFAVAVAVSLIHFVLFLQNDRTSSQLKSIFPFSVARNLAGDLITISDPRIRITASFIYTTIYLVLPIVATFAFIYQHLGKLTQVMIFSLPAIPVVVLTALFGGHAASGYFVLSGLMTLNIVVLLYVSNNLSFFAQQRKFLLTLAVLAIVGIVLGLLSHRMLTIYDSGSPREILIRSIIRAHWIFAIIAAMVWAFWSWIKKLPTYPFLLLFVFIEMVCFLTIEVINLDRLTKGPELTSQESAIAIGTADEISAGEWIRSNTDLNTVVATNHFCGGACSGKDWFELDYALLDDTFNFPASPTGYGTFNFILSIYAERRFYIEGARFLLVNGMPKEQVRERMNLVLAFANSPDSKSLDALRDKGIDYFVVDKSSTSVRDWKDFGNIRYENETFIVLELI